MFKSNLSYEENILKEAKQELSKIQEEYLDYQSCKNIFTIINDTINKNPKKTIEQILEMKEGGVKIWVLDSLAFVAQRYIESGNYHVYRGVLNEQGKEVLKLYDSIYDKMLKMNIAEVNEQYVKEWKEYIREQIKILG